MRVLWHLIVLLALSPLTLAAQEPAALAKSSGGYKVDFTNQDIRVVLSALAEAAGVNITFSNLPPTPVTLHLGQPVPKEQVLDIMRNVTEQNGLTFAMEGSLVRIGLAQQSSPLGDFAAFRQPKVELYTYRLKHAHAAEIAPLLMNLFAGTTVGGGSSSGGGDGGINGGNGGAGAPQISFSLGDAFGGGGGGIVVTRPIGGGGGGGGGDGGGIVPGGSPGGGGGGGIVLGGSDGGLQNLSQQLGSAFGQAIGQGGGPPTVSQVRIVAEESTNTLLIRATAEEWGLIQKILKDIDLRPLQVLIEAVIVEVTRTRDLNVGV